MTDQENFYRFSSIIVDHGKEALVILLDNDLSKQNLSFENFLNKHQHEIYHLHYVDKKLRCCQCPSGSSPQTGSHRVLHVDQLDILLDEHGQKLPCHCTLSTRPYCCSLAKPSVTTNDLDITLARCLLVNFSTICSPGSPIRHAVDVIVDYRNKSYGHAREAKMSASDFQNNVANVETAILSIAKVCNVEIDMKQKLQDAKNRSLDPTLCIQYQNLLLQEMDRKAVLEENISIIKCQSELMSSQIQSHQIHVDEQLQTHFQETTSMFSDIRITQEDLKERAEVLVDRVEVSKTRTQADIQEQHDKLQTHVDKTHVNIVTSITDTRNVIQKNMNDYEARLHKHIDDAMRQAVKRIPTDQRKQNIIAQANSRLTRHRQNECYVAPLSVEKGKEILKKHSILIIVSKRGEGKTTTALQLATIYKDLGYIPYWFVDQDIRQFRDIINPNDKCIIVMDDMFGRRFTEFDENIHRNILDILHAIVINSPEVKLVFAINSDDNCWQNIKTEHAIFMDDFILDLDRTSKLSFSEKTSILYKYMERFKISICSCHERMPILEFYEAKRLRAPIFCDNYVEELSNESIQICKGAISRILEMDISTGFPETCRLFCSNHSLTLLGPRYFENPKQSLIDKIDALYVEGHDKKIARYQYCLLVYTALKGYIELEDAENSFVHDDLFSDIFLMFDDNSLKPKKMLIEALKKLNGKFLEEKKIYYSGRKKDALMFKHETISDAVLLSYGNENTSIEKFGLEFIYTYVRPNTSKRKKSSQTLYFPDNLICDRFKQILKMKNKNSIYIQKAYVIGNYIRRSQMEEKNCVFMKTFFELVPISYFESYQVSELFDALTKYGEYCEIIHSYLNKFGLSIWKHGSNEIIYSICRPQSTIVDPMKYVLCSDEAMVKKLLNIILSHDKENITPLVDVGEYLYTLSREENYNFVISFLSRMAMKLDARRPSYIARLIIDGFTKEGERKELIPIYRLILSRFIPWNCSINVIFKFCRPSIPREDCNDQVLLVDRETLINQLIIAFRKCLFGTRLNYYCYRSSEMQVEEIGRNCYIFLSSVKDKSLLDEIVDAFVTVIQQKFSVKSPISQSLNFSCYSNKDPKFTLSFFDGLTSFGEHLQPLKETFPNLIENLERHTSRYRYIRKLLSSKKTTI